MQICAHLENALDHHIVTVRTGGAVKALSIPPRTGARGSSVNGGELLCLALATCYCNDLHREAERRGLVLERIEVDVEARFDREGGAASAIEYRARLWGNASRDVLLELARHTDSVSEIQNTVRGSSPVALTSVTVQTM